MRRNVFGILVVALISTALVAGVATADTKARPGPLKSSAQLRKAVEPAGILVHERRFQRIATANDGTRASGTPGYDASADYVVNKLENAGYDVRVQTFDFPFFQEISSSFSQTATQQRDFAPYDLSTGEGDYAVMTYSGSGTVTDTAVQAVDVRIPPPAQPGSTSGCEAADFAGFTPGNVALIQRGTCDFSTKARNAEAAGAAAVVIFNEGQPGRTEVVQGTLGEPGIEIPVIGVSYALGEELRQSGTRVSLATETESEVRETSNVIADTPTGKGSRTVVVGAHLDSVLEGAGINDNGSGTATTLEVALKMSQLKVKPVNKVRFAFWGAEELGLIGSEEYLSSLPEGQLDRIALNLNFDMLGSPNFVRFVYDGDGSDTPDSGPAGSAQIEDTFTDYFKAQKLRTSPTAFDGRSDYGPFITRGIPAGGLFSGAEGIKTAEEQRIYGGDAGVAYDECYHQACDDISNLSIRSLDQMSDAVAHSTLTYANAKSLFTDNARTKGSNTFEYDEYKGSELIR